MTPEERAAQVAHFENDKERARMVAAAIREAVAEERERCAKIADEIEPSGDWYYNDEDGSYWESDWRKTKGEIARLIRNPK